MRLPSLPRISLSRINLSWTVEALQKNMDSNIDVKCYLWMTFLYFFDNEIVVNEYKKDNILT